MPDQKITERLWDEYFEKNIKTGTSPNDIKVLNQVFYAGMFAMFKELTEVHRLMLTELHTEFTEYIKELKDANR